MSNPVRLKIKRGETLKIAFTLDAPWEPAMFTAGIFLTVRREIPPSTVLDDNDALGQCSTLDDGITFVGQDGTAKISDEITAEWPTGVLHWDIEARVASPRYVKYPAWGTLAIDGDVTRGTWPAED